MDLVAVQILLLSQGDCSLEEHTQDFLDLLHLIHYADARPSGDISRVCGLGASSSSSSKSPSSLMMLPSTKSVSSPITKSVLLMMLPPSLAPPLLMPYSYSAVSADSLQLPLHLTSRIRLGLPVHQLRQGVSIPWLHLAPSSESQTPPHPVDLSAPSSLRALPWSVITLVVPQTSIPPATPCPSTLLAPSGFVQSAFYRGQHPEPGRVQCRLYTKTT